MKYTTEVRSDCTQILNKPKLVFLRSTAPNPAHFTRLHLQEHLKCLVEFFDVILIDKDDCDYKSICETYKPDLSLFESGVYVTRDKHRIIRNTDAYPEIPKLGLCNGDAYCQTRQLFLSDMDRWDINTFFTISVSMAEYTPDIGDRLFVWPNFIDGDLYKDYGEPKLIPVLFSGSFAAHYPWRNQVHNRLSHCYPTLRCPHLGWGGPQSTGRMVYGEQYARLLNASLAAPACGTIANDIVRKHFEIPGSKSCLVAPRIPALEAAGFVDMENCVFAEPADVVDKLDYLFMNRDELEGITSAGYKLVHSAHTLKQRDQLYRWFRLHTSLQADYKIIQPGPFRPLTVVHKRSAIRHSHLTVNGLDRLLLRQGDQKLWSGNYTEAESLFVKCLTYYNMPEPKLRIVITKLLAGEPAAARHWIVSQIKSTLGGNGATTPDPVEWAYLILTTLCQGREKQALKYASTFSNLHHVELDRARFIAEVVAGRSATRPPPDLKSKQHYTIHQLPEFDMETWLTHVSRMLAVCGQQRFVERITNTSNRITASMRSAVVSEAAIKRSSNISGRLSESPLRPLWLTLFVNITRPSYVRIKRVSRSIVDAIEARLGYFLPYELSTARCDELFAKLETICRNGNIGNVVIMGARSGNYVTEACLRGVRYNSNRPSVLCVSNDKRSFVNLQRRYRYSYYEEKSHNIVAKYITDKTISITIVDGSELAHTDQDYSSCYSAAHVVLDGLCDVRVLDIYQNLMARSEYALTGHNPEHRRGYAIFTRIGH